MRIQWGTNNQSITLFATGSGDTYKFDKLHLALIEKQVCDMYQYKSTMVERVLAEQKKMNEKCGIIADLKERLKNRTIWGWITRNF